MDYFELKDENEEEMRASTIPWVHSFIYFMSLLKFAKPELLISWKYSSLITCKIMMADEFALR